MSAEWQKIKQQGNPPCGRVGHSMSFLPVNQALLIVGGRNDEVCKSLNTPFLNDIHLFLLDQKAWVSVKYTPQSQKLFRIGNHSMTTISDSEKYEKTIVFGGITHSKIGPQGPQIKVGGLSQESIRNQSSSGSAVMSKEKEEEKESSHLSNDLYALEIRQIM